MRERNAVVLVGGRDFRHEYSLERLDAYSSTSSSSREPGSKGPQRPNNIVARAGGNSADGRLSLRETEGCAVWRAGASLARVDVGLARFSIGDAAKSCALQTAVLVVACRRCIEQVRVCARVRGLR